MTIDDDGCLWVALWGGGAIHRYTPTGRLDTVLTLPVSQVTSCAFGGARSRDLYITTSTLGSEHAARSRMPAGAVYHWSPGVSGPVAVPFGG
jgi:sugar lactone lactonase YvrE